MGNCLEEAREIIVDGIQKVQDSYDNCKGRNEKHRKVFDGCGRPTQTFLKYNIFDGPGRITGRCGYKKDHARNFCCQKCYDQM